MLTDKIATLFTSGNDHQALRNELTRYALGITSAKSANDVARENEVFNEAFKELKHNFFRTSEYTLTKLWKAAVKVTDKPKCQSCTHFKTCKSLASTTAAKCKSFKFDDAKMNRRYGVPKADLDLIRNLTPEDHVKIQKRYAARLRRAGNFTLDDVYDDLLEWCTKFANKKFRFIVQYYWDVEIDDIINDFMVEAQIRALECETMRNQLHFLNALKKRVKQRASNMMDHYTAGTRRRIEKNQEAYKQEIEFYAKRSGLQDLSFAQKEKRFKHVVKMEYRLGTLSMDYQNESDDGEDQGNLHSVIGQEVNFTQKNEEKDFVQELMQFIDNQAMRKAVRVILGRKFDEDFANYIKPFGTMTDVKFKSKVLEYYDINEEDFEEVLTTALIQTKVINKDNLPKLANLSPKNTVLQIAKV